MAKKKTGTAEQQPAEGTTPPAAAAPAPAAPAKVERQKANGVTRPAAGTTTARVWEIADEISAREKRPAKRSEVLKQFVEVEKNNPATGATQFGRWMRFYGVTKAQVAEPAAEATASA